MFNTMRRSILDHLFHLATALRLAALNLLDLPLLLLDEASVVPTHLGDLSTKIISFLLARNDSLTVLFVLGIARLKELLEAGHVFGDEVVFALRLFETNFGIGTRGDQLLPSLELNSKLLRKL